MKPVRHMGIFSSSKAYLAIGLGIVFLVSLTTGPIPDVYPDHYYQYDAYEYDVSNDEVVRTHVLTDVEKDSPTFRKPTPEELEQLSADESALSEPERKAIEEGRVRTTKELSVRDASGPSAEDVSEGDIYEVDGKYYELLGTGSWSQMHEGGQSCLESTIGDATFCDDGPPVRWGAILFTAGGYLVGGFLAFRGW